MNPTVPRSEKRRSLAPLLWAGMGTLVLHAAFLLALWLWPRPPVKPREVLLEVKLAQYKPPKPTPVPTPKPLKVVKPRVVPTPKPKPQPRIKPKPRVVVRPKPIRTKPPRIAKRDVPRPTPPPILRPTLPPPPTPPPPTPVPTVPPPTPVPRPTVPPRKLKTPPVVPPSSSAPKGKTTAPPKNASTKTPNKSKPASSPSGGPKTLPPKAGPSGGGSPRRRYALNDAEPNDNPGRKGEGQPSTPNRTNNAPGTNSGGNSNETAGAAPGIDLPRTPAQGGRRKKTRNPVGSAPTKKEDGTEVNIGPSAPTSSGGGRQRPDATSGYGNGDEKTGAPRTGGIPNADGGANGNSKAGRGADEAAGQGVGGNPRGSGARGNSRRGRPGTRIANDPFSTGNGSGGTGNGQGTGGEGGNGTGPRGGTRLAKRGLGDGEADGNGGGVGRGNGLGSGKGDGQGPGDSNGGGGGKGRGAGGDDIADGGSSESAGGGGGGRRRGGRGTRRTGDTEDQIGRGIWGGFKMTFYQDKSRYPDDIDTRTIQGNPIDWNVFSKRIGTKTEPNLDFDWGTTPPLPGMKDTYWSMKANGRIFVPKDDTYTFFFDRLDDAGRLILDGQTIIDVWQVQQSTPSSEKLTLTRGAHDIQIQYVQGPATAASIKLSWRSTSFPKETVGVYQAPEKE